MNGSIKNFSVVHIDRKYMHSLRRYLCKNQQHKQNKQTQPESDNNPVQLQLSDLLLCAQALQLASTRGAFRAEEFTQIGGVFDRITAFLKASGALASSLYTNQ
jgi:hypothetical protein